MSIFQEILNACQIEALDSTLNPTEDYVYRKMCRAYSMKFNTPLLEVYKMDLEHIAQNLLELKHEDVDVEDSIDSIIELINKIEDPNYQANEDKEMDEFVKASEELEEERLKQGLKPGSIKKSLLKKEEEKPKIQPQGGSINLSYLEDMEKEE